jgi:CO dehydrogenase maturation factor
MKVAVCGKGGSGKSTVVSFLATNILARGYRVLVVDSDESNSGLYRMLGFDRLPNSLMDFLGGKKMLKQKMGEPSIFTEARISMNDIPEPSRVARNGLNLVTVGKIQHALEGCACPMGVLSREFLTKLTTQPNEIVIVDMEAGIEHFGRGVETAIDSVLILVEPSLESIELTRKIYHLAKDLGISSIWAVLNKITSADIAEKAEATLQQYGIQIIGHIRWDVHLFEASLEGKVPADGTAADEIKKILDVILSGAVKKQQ